MLALASRYRATSLMRMDAETFAQLLALRDTKPELPGETVGIIAEFDREADAMHVVGLELALEDLLDRPVIVFDADALRDYGDDLVIREAAPLV